MWWSVVGDVHAGLSILRWTGRHRAAWASALSDVDAVIAVQCCETCGAEYEVVRKWNGGNPISVLLPTCDCEEQASEPDFQRMIAGIQARREAMTDLPPEEWDEALRAAKEGGAEITENTHLVRSHVFQLPDCAIWTLYAPAEGLEATGQAKDVSAAYAAMDEQLAAWFPEPLADDKKMTIVRLVGET